MHLMNSDQISNSEMHFTELSPHNQKLTTQTIQQIRNSKNRKLYTSIGTYSQNQHLRANENIQIVNQFSEGSNSQNIGFQ